MVDCWLRGHLIGRGGCCAHEKARRCTCPEHLSPFLEIDIFVTSHVDELENIFKSLERGWFFVGLVADLLHHFVELLKIEVSSPWVVPLHQQMLTFLNASFGEIM